MVIQLGLKERELGYKVTISQKLECSCLISKDLARKSVELACRHLGIHIKHPLILEAPSGTPNTSEGGT